MLAEGRGDWLSEVLRVGQHYRQLSDVQISVLVEPLEAKVKQMAEVMSWNCPRGSIIAAFLPKPTED